MSSPDRRAARLLRMSAALALAAMTGGCFQPMLADRSGPAGNASISNAMRGVDIAPLNTPRGTRLDRIGVEMRNDLIFALTGGGGGASPTHRLSISISGGAQALIVDIQSGRPDVQNYVLNASYTLTDIATGKPVVNGSTFANVSYTMPGQQQRFVGERGLRDAENRAAQVISDNIRNRLASYFTAGT